MDLRCFIAVAIPDTIRGEIGEVIEILKKYDADIKWVVIDNFHLTLKFLGRTPEELLPQIRESLSNIISSYEPFYIKIKGTGIFPNKKFPRVIWVGVEDEGTLLKLAGDIDYSMSLLGYKREDREFSPHLTLGRVRSRRGIISIVNELDNFEKRDFGLFSVSHIKLMKSELRPKGPEYSCLHEIPLGKAILS